MLKIFLFFFLFLLPLHAEDLQRQRLAWQMEGGDVRNIAGLCRQYVQKKFEAQKTFSVEALLQDRDVARACYMAHFFSLVGKDRTYLLHELKDKEYVQWLLEHPEVFEKLSFAHASGKDTLAVLRNIWLKEGKELSGVGLNMALGAALISTSREPEACEARYDFYKKSFAEKNCFRRSLRWNRGNSAFFSGAGKVLRSLPGHRITWLAKRRSRRGTQGMPVAV